MADDEDSLLTVAETAKLLRRSTEQVRRYLREGLLSGRRMGGQWFVHHADAEAFLRHRHESVEFRGWLQASDPDPLAGVIAIGGSGGADVSAGRIAYFRAQSRGQ